MDAVKVIKKSGAPGAVPAVTAYVDEPLLPKVSAEDSGKVIGVDENGELDVVTVSVPQPTEFSHTILLFSSDNVKRYRGILILKTNSNTPFTLDTLKEYINTNYPTGTTDCVGYSQQVGYESGFNQFRVDLLTSIAVVSNALTMQFSSQLIEIDASTQVIHSVKSNQSKSASVGTIVDTVNAIA